MPEINLLAVAVATVAAFIVGGVWYGIFGNAMAALQAARAAAGPPSSQMPAWKFAVEIGRSLMVAVVVAFLLGQMGVTGWGQALLYGFCLWLAFPVVLLLGAIIHENVPWKLGAIHAGDWLIKLGAIALIVGLWR